ncbi:MAG: alpha/beta hydrolase [Rhodobacteraceae bacterium]|nr:alpha/beta hydrolase [Paracoccaceae bacterium]
MTADYTKLLDAEVWAFLARTEEFYPPDAVDLTVADQRRVYDEMCAAFDVGRPDGVTTEDTDMDGVPCRIYTPATPPEATIYFCHGGGFVVGGLDSHDSICAEFCDQTGMRVVAADYRMSPEHPFPNDFNDAWAAFAATCAAFDGPVVLAGDSAGGCLVAAVAHHARGRISDRITGALLIYPGLGGPWTERSYQEHPEAPGLTVKDMEFYRLVRSGGKEITDDPTYAPLQDTDYSGLPPTVILTAQCDPLSSDGDVYARRLTEAGGAALWHEDQGLVHAHLRARHMSAKARDSFARMIASLTSLKSGHLPTFTS